MIHPKSNAADVDAKCMNVLNEARMLRRTLTTSSFQACPTGFALTMAASREKLVRSMSLRRPRAGFWVERTLSYL